MNKWKRVALRMLTAAVLVLGIFAVLWWVVRPMMENVLLTGIGVK